MKKTLSILALALAMLLLSVLTAHADTLTMQDPLDLGFDMSFAENLDNEFCYKRRYTVADTSDARDVVLAYMEQLMQHKELVYVECTTNPDGWIYHGFQAAEGYSYDTYYTHNGDWRTLSHCASVFYRPGNVNVYFSFSTDFTLWTDSTNSNANSNANSKSDSVTPRNTPRNTPNSRTNEPRKCSVCNGTGYRNCLSCNGRGEIDCGGCYNGRVRTIDGGSKTCSSCRGTGERDCPGCNGKGEKKCTMCGGDGER